ncbi:MAG TPA: DUF6788 family protein [Methylomirabilota bacterium]|nr:DUF6788 family protein [Methylomirabilota bacterium]
MPVSIQALRSQRDVVLQRMQQIDHLRRGTLSRQFFKTRRDGKIVESGPYFVLQCSFKGKKCSERIPTAEAERAEQHVENFRLFNGLAEEFVTLSDQITQLECAVDNSKKNASNRTSARKNDSGKPRHS